MCLRPMDRWITGLDHQRNSKLGYIYIYIECYTYRGADKSLARPTSRCILFDGENISFDASLIIHI